MVCITEIQQFSSYPFHLTFTLLCNLDLLPFQKFLEYSTPRLYFTDIHTCLKAPVFMYTQKIQVTRVIFHSIALESVAQVTFIT